LFEFFSCQTQEPKYFSGNTQPNLKLMGILFTEKQILKLGMVVHACHPSALEAEAGGLQNLRSERAT
jgi:hypothetical protein